MKLQRRNTAVVLSLALGGGILAGALMLLADVIFNDYRGGIVPFWLGAAILIVIAAGAALLSVGSAFIVFVTLTRFLRSRSFIVIVCAVVAALVGGVVGIRFSIGSGSWLDAVLWTLVPALYVAITFPRLESSRKNA